MKILRLILTLCFVFSAASLMAQSRHYNSQTLGMGRGGTAFIDGYHANFLNPANLMINNTGRKPKNSIGIGGGIGFSAGGTLLNQRVYEDYLTKGYTIADNVAGQSATLRTDMLNDWFGSSAENTREVSFGLQIVPFGFSHRGKNSAFSVATRVRTLNDFSINKGFAELAFYGFDSQKFGDPVPVNFTNTVLSYAEISVGYAMKLPIPFTGMIEKLPFINGVNVYAGVAPKYIVGLQSMDFDFNSTLQVNSSAVIHDFNYTLTSFGDLSEELSAYAAEHQLDPDAKLDLNYDGSDIGNLGSGFGVDLGLTAEVDVSLPALGFLGKRQVLRLGMSLTDLGSVTYDASPSQITASDRFTLDGNIGDKTVGDYFDDLSDSLQNDVYGGFAALQTEAKKYSLPGMYNFGAALTLGKLTTTLDYGVGFNDLGRNTKVSRANLGLEYRLFNFIPLRFGTRIGGESAATYSAGFGFDFRFFDFTFAASTVKSGSDGGSSYGVAMSGLVIRF